MDFCEQFEYRLEAYFFAIINQVIEESKLDLKNQILSSNNDYNYQNIINFVIENGFTEEEAIIALSAVGNDIDMILQYLYSQNYK